MNKIIQEKASHPWVRQEKIIEIGHSLYVQICDITNTVVFGDGLEDMKNIEAKTVNGTIAKESDFARILQWLKANISYRVQCYEPEESLYFYKFLQDHGYLPKVVVYADGDGGIVMEKYR